MNKNANIEWARFGPIKVSVITVTPQMAQEWLESQDNIRRLSASEVAKHSNNLINGKHKLNGQTIVFNKYGKLIDGQHRLTACAETGVSFETVAVYGVDNSDGIDEGKKRTTADILGGTGLKYATIRQSMVRALYYLRKGGDPWLDTGAVSNAELVGLHNSLAPAAVDEAVRLAAVGKMLVRPSATATFAYQAMQTHGVDFVSEWLSNLFAGVGLQPKSTELFLRRYLEAHGRKGRGEDTRASYVAICRAWDCYVHGKPMEHINALWVRNRDGELPVVA